MKRLRSALIPILTIVIVSIYVSVVIFKPGYIYFRDVTESIDVSKLYERYIYTYSNDIGESLAEKSRIPIFYFLNSIFSVGKALRIFDDSGYVKIKILSLFVLSLSIFIYTTYKLLKELQKDEEKSEKKDLLLSLAASLGGVYYVGNYWFSNRIAHFGLFFSTVTIPGVFYLLYKYYFSEETNFKRLVALLIFLFIFTGTPHTLIFISILFFALYISFIFNKNFNKKTKIDRTKQTIIFFVLYLFSSLYWVLPYLSSYASSPDAVLTETIVNDIGKNSYLYNSVRLVGYWLNSAQDYMKNVPPEMFSLSSVLPLFIAIASIIMVIKKKGLSLSLLIMLVIGVFMSTSSEITNSFYFPIMFKSPIKNFGWLFREYDKLGAIVAYVYALGISIFLAKSCKKDIYVVGTLIITSLILYTNVSFLRNTLVKNYTPQNIPNDFSQVIDYIKNDREEFNTAWYPGVPLPIWAEEEDVRFWFSNVISYQKPAIAVSSSIVNYLNYLFNEENIYSIDMGRALNVLGVKYLVIRKDYAYAYKNGYEEKIALQKSLEKVFETSLLTVYKNKSFTGLSGFYTSSVNTNRGLDIFKNLENKTGSFAINFSDKGSDLNFNNQIYDEKSPAIDYAIEKYKDKFIYPYDYSTLKYDDAPGTWKIGSLENINHAETDFFFGNEGIRIPQFDYEHGIVVAKDGYDKFRTSVNPFRYTLFFEDGYEENVFDGKDLSFKPKTSIFDGPWHETKSSKFDLNNALAIEVSLVSSIPNNLDPHFKINFYNNDQKIIKTVVTNASRYRTVNPVIAVPKEAVSASFSIWSRNTLEPSGTLQIKNLQITDVSNVVVPVSMSIKTKTQCKKNCTVYARVLTSRIGGEIEVKINNNSFFVTTFRDYEVSNKERYDWIEVGKIASLNRSAEIVLSNLSGFNSINALVILDEKQVSEINNDIRNIESSGNNLEDKGLYIDVEKVNPTKYILTPHIGSTGKGVLTLSKPFNKNWILSGKPAKLINGYSNGWEIENLERKEYVVEYRPQRYFYIGAIFSSINIIALLVYYFFIPQKQEK